MSEIIYGIVLGIIQGITEFLPISSDGHLELVKFFFGDDSEGHKSWMLTVVLHLGTALATVVVFRKEILDLFKALFNKSMVYERDFIVKVIISMLPAAILGVAFQDQLEAFFTGKIGVVFFFLLVTGILLYFADKSKNTGKPIDKKSALILGFAQAAALLPGLSRSGSTISTSMLMGIDKSEATKFSFIMVLPIIFGKIFKDFTDGTYTSADLSLNIVIPGLIASFVMGIIACKVMINFVKNSKLIYFSYYCIVVGVFGLIYYFFIQ
jgi:undecaprenyl-diphosphatase